MEKYWFFLTFVTKNAYYLNKIKTTSEKKRNIYDTKAHHAPPQNRCLNTIT